MDFREPCTFFGRTAFIVLPVVFGDKINTDIPNVSNKTVFSCVYSEPTNITNFTGGSANQTIRIKGDGVATIVNGTNIYTNTSADKLLAANKIYVFTLIDNIWYEDAP